jgi:hypothetical protein
MSDNESISHTSAAEEVNVHDIIAQIREHHKRADELLKQTEKMMKKVKVKVPKSAADRKPRKASEGQKRWRAFQSYIWELLKADNPTTPYKEAMRVAGERKREGYLDDGSKTLTKFETWLKANPIPSDEERAAAKAKKDAAVKAARDAKKNAKKTSAKKQSASAAKAAANAETDAGTTDVEPLQLSPRPLKARSPQPLLHLLHLSPRHLQQPKLLLRRSPLSLLLPLRIQRL